MRADGKIERIPVSAVQWHAKKAQHLATSTIGTVERWRQPQGGGIFSDPNQDSQPETIGY